MLRFRGLTVIDPGQIILKVFKKQNLWVCLPTWSKETELDLER